MKGLNKDKEKDKRFGIKDLKFFALLALVLGLLFLVRSVFFHTPGGKVTIEVDGKTMGTWSLHKNLEIPIRNKDGVLTNRLQIKDGKAKMIEADCPDHLCMNQNAISKDGETIVCLPNKVVVTVIADKELDAVTG